MEQRYFVWSDDADPIPFRLNSLGERVVSGDSLIYMVKVLIGTYEQGDASPVGALTPQQVVEDIVALTKTYQPKVDEAVLEQYPDLPVVNALGEEVEVRLCDCGHFVSLHQSGDGPWAGFCYAAPDDGCKCESPTIDGQEVK